MLPTTNYKQNKAVVSIPLRAPRTALTHLDIPRPYPLGTRAS